MKFFAKSLDANTDKRRQSSASKPLATSRAAAICVAIFFRVGAGAITIFKINAKIFDGFANEFFPNTLENRFSEN